MGGMPNKVPPSHAVRGLRAGRPKSAKAAAVVETMAGERVPDAELAHLHPAIRAFAVRTDSLTRDPRNARRHDDRNLKAIAASLRENRQQPSGVLTFDPATRQIKVGSGRHEAATDPRWGLNWRWIAAVPSDLPPAELKRYALADNRTSELGAWDAAEVERQLAELAEELDGFDAGDSLGISDAELDALLKGDVEAAHGFGATPAAKAPPEPPPAPPAGEQTYQAKWLVVVQCRDEAHQAELIDEFGRRDLTFTAPSA
ncbi:MAG: hypothetical protein JWO31_2834 [Phycisphaerales bacterium]|nr:hypothetical protein [Phycisphaerales bacterium]